MTTLTDEALAVRAAKWCGLKRHRDGVDGDYYDIMSFKVDAYDLDHFAAAPSALLLSALLEKLPEVSIYRRGKVYRAHAVRATNHWAESRSPVLALLRALDAAGVLP